MSVTKLILKTKSCTPLKTYLTSRQELSRTVAPTLWNVMRLTKHPALYAAQILTLTPCN
jgi:hypothetical protein